MVISNNYKKFIDSLDPESQDRPKLIDKKIYNTRRYANCFTRLSEEDCLNRNISDWSNRAMLEIRDLIVHQYCNVIYFGPKNEKKSYEKGERGEKDAKSQKVGKNY